jgi:hypothetical protein
MTTFTETTVLDPSAPRVEPDPTRAFRSAATTALAVAAPVLFTLSNVALPKLTGSTANVVAHIPAVATRLLAVHLVYAVASLLIVFLAVALWRIDARRGAVVRLIGGGLLIVGAVSNALGEVVDGYLAWGLHHVGVASADQVRLFDLLDNSSAALPISFIAIPVLSLGLLVLMAGVAMARVVPLWLPVLTVVGGIAAGFVGVGPASLVGLVWSFAAAAVVLLVARTAPRAA